MKIRVLLVDDHAVLREGMRRLLEREKDIEVVGEGSDGEEAVKLVSKLKPDLVLMDIVMPKITGVEATYRIKQANPTTNVLILTAYSDTHYILGLLEAGACGYLLKNAHSVEVTGAIRAVASGESVLDPTITRKLLQRVMGATTGPQGRVGNGELSEREIAVLKMASKGMTNKEIARSLFLSVRTIKAYLTSIFNKLDCGCRTDAIVKGLREGIITIEETIPDSAREQ